MKKHDVIVVIPVHSPNPLSEELFSFKQCFQVLSNHDILVVHPEGLDLRKYTDTQPTFKSISIDPVWQSSLENYNKLKCSEYFYNLFSDYDFLLTYELDAFVFNDELLHWAKKGYDYVGAPWFKGYGVPVKPYQITGIGNSGFSLRNVNSCIAIINKIRKLKRINKFYSSLGLNKIYSFAAFLRVTKLARYFNIRDVKHLQYLIHCTFVNEDLFWSVWVHKTFSDFNIAPVSEAIKFSFEVNPEYLYKKNNYKLPFGCHAWMKYDNSFWDPFIKYN